MELSEITIKELVSQAVNQPVIFSIKDDYYKMSLVPEDTYDDNIRNIMKYLLNDKVDIHRMINTIHQSVDKNISSIFIVGHKKGKSKEHLPENYNLFKIEYSHGRLTTAFGQRIS